jgi:hypothetical protein
MRRADGHALATCGSAATQYGRTGLRLHARAKAVRFRTVAAVGLECAFGHDYPLLFPKENLRFSSKFEYISGRE